MQIAASIFQNSAILLVDEPTNHMDLAAIEILKEALKLYQGILVAISHDVHFVKNVCEKTLYFTKNNSMTMVSFI